MTDGQDPTRDALDQAMVGLVRDQQQWIARDPVRVRTLLQHAFAGSPVAQSRDAEATVLAIQFGVFDVLAAPHEASVDTLVGQMVGSGGATHDEARWAVGSWARAAGVALPAAAPLAGTIAVPPPAAPPYPPAAVPTPPLPQPDPQSAAPPPTQPAAQWYTQPNTQPYAQAAGAGAAPAYPAYPAGPPGHPPTTPPPLPAPGGYGAPPPTPSSGSKAALLIGLVVLVAVLLIGGLVAFALTRRTEVAQDPVTVPSTTAAPATTLGSTTTDPDPSTTRRSTTTTRRPTTTTDAPTTTAPAWTTFTDPSGRYSIDFPGSPTLQTTSTNIGGDDVGIFDYAVVSQGVDYELAVAELPPGYFFPNPQSTLENVIGSFVGTDGGSVVARDDAPFAGNPALFLDIKGANQEVQVFGLISGNRIYVMVAKGEDLSAADFARFRASFQIH